MTDTDLDALEALERGMTPAPWGTTRYAGGFNFDGPLSMYAGTDPEYGEPRKMPASEGDVRALVALRNAAPALLAELRALRTWKQEALDDPNWA